MLNRCLLVAGLVWLAAGVSPGTAQAKKKAIPAAEAAATRAEAALEEHCSSVESENVTAAAESVAALGAVWTELSTAIGDSGEPYLLYWRGALAQCVGQDTRALDDLGAFLAAAEESGLWGDLVPDAEYRVDQLDPPPPPRRAALPDELLLPVIAVASLGGGSLLLGLGSGGAWNASQQQAELLYQGTHIGGGTEPYLTSGESAANGSRFLGVMSLLSGAAAGVTAVLTLWRPQDRTRGRFAAVPVAQPLPGGLSMHLVGRW